MIEPEDWAAFQAEERRERERSIAAHLEHLQEATRKRTLAAWEAHAAAGRKPWKVHLTSRLGHPDQRRPRYLLAFERDERRMRRGLEGQGYDVHEIEPWTGPMPDPLTGRVD